jgi:outer membrane lipoprotein SlyB
MENPTRSTHPLILVAASAVTIASFAAVASLAGWLPGNHTAPAAPVAQLATAVQTPATAVLPPEMAPTPASEKTATLNIPSGSSITVNPAKERPAHQAAAPRKATVSAPAVTPVSSPKPAPIFDENPGYGNRDATPVSNTPVNDNGIYVENSRKPPSICHDCGTVESIREIAQEGQGSGLGAIAGGVLGGLLGNQIGNGSGRKVATVAGVVGGAYAGHTVEKSTRSSQQFQVTVRLDDGSMRTINETQKPAWRAGDRVRISNDHLSSL